MNKEGVFFMSATVNSGSDYEIRNITLSSTADTPIDFNNRFINSIFIKCRTAVDLYLRRLPSSANYITIPAGSSFTLDCAVSDQSQGGYIAGYLRAATGSPVAEILGTY